MATECIGVPEPIKTPIFRQEGHVTHLIENNNIDISPIHPMTSVPDYATFQQPIIAVGGGGSVARDISPRGVSIESTTEYIYLADMYNSRIQIFSQTGEHIHHFGDTHLSRPWGILVHQDSIFITDEGHQAVFLFRLSDLLMVKRAGNKGSGSKEFNRPKQLAISPNQHVYVADLYNNRLQILTTDLEFKGTLRHKTMTNPCDLKFSNNEIFVLSYTDNPSIHVFTLSGEKSRSIPNNGVEQAWFFCMDGHNNIVFSDYFDRSIKVFSPRGRLLYTIELKSRKAGMLIHPFGVTINNNRRVIFVSDNINYCIQIFS